MVRSSSHKQTSFWLLVMVCTKYGVSGNTFSAGTQLEGEYSSHWYCCRWGWGCADPCRYIHIALTVRSEITVGWNVTINFCSEANSWGDIQVNITLLMYFFYKMIVIACVLLLLYCHYINHITLQ